MLFDYLLQMLGDFRRPTVGQHQARGMRRTGQPARLEAVAIVELFQSREIQDRLAAEAGLDRRNDPKVPLVFLPARRALQPDGQAEPAAGWRIEGAERDGADRFHLAGLNADRVNDSPLEHLAAARNIPRKPPPVDRLHAIMRNADAHRPLFAAGQDALLDSRVDQEHALAVELEDRAGIGKFRRLVKEIEDAEKVRVPLGPGRRVGHQPEAVAVHGRRVAGRLEDMLQIEIVERDRAPLDLRVFVREPQAGDLPPAKI